MKEAGPLVKGRIVRYFEVEGPEDGCAAIVCCVLKSSRLNLLVLNEQALGTAELAVPCAEEAVATGARNWWKWAQRT